jgi:hypothetical protein
MIILSRLSCNARHAVYDIMRIYTGYDMKLDYIVRLLNRSIFDFDLLIYNIFSLINEYWIDIYDRDIYKLRQLILNCYNKKYDNYDLLKLINIYLLLDQISLTKTVLCNYQDYFNGWTQKGVCNYINSIIQHILIELKSMFKVKYNDQLILDIQKNHMREYFKLSDILIKKLFINYFLI